MESEEDNIIKIQFDLIKDQQRTINKLTASMLRSGIYRIITKDGEDISLTEAVKYEDRANGL